MDKNKLPQFLSSVEGSYEHIAYALEMRANFIETGEVTLSRQDIAKRDVSRLNSTDDHIKAAIRRILSLSDEQQDIIKKLRVLAIGFRSIR